MPTITLIHLSVIPVLAGDGTIFVDNRAHKTIYDGCQFASARGATVKRFRFEDPDDLEQLLREDRSTTRLICMDGVNSMTGNAPDLKDFARLARRYDAMLYVDDAHGFGVIGERDAERAEPVRHAREQHRPVLRRVVRPHRPRRRLLEGVLVARGVRRVPDRAQAAAQDRGARRTSTPGPRRSPRSRPCSPASTSTRSAAMRFAPTSGGRRIRCSSASIELGVYTPNRSGLPDHRGAARAPRGDRRGGPLPLRPRRLRDACRLPARAEERGRVPDPGHRCQHRRPRSSSSSTCSASSPSGSSFGRRAERQREYARVSVRQPRRSTGAGQRLGAVPRRWRHPHRSSTSGLPPLAGERPAHQPARPLLVARDRGRDLTCTGRRRAPPGCSSRSASSCSSPATSTRTATRSCFGAEVGFPSLGDAIYLDGLPGARSAGLLMLVRRAQSAGATAPA